MNKTKILSLIIIGVVFSSCISIKKFKQSDLNAYNTLRDTTKTEVVDSIKNFTWKDIFMDQQLQSLIEEGIKNNSDMIIAMENLYQSQQFLKSSKSKYAPTLNLNATIQHSNTTLPKEQYLLGGTIGWEPDIWGKITASVRADRAALLRDEVNVRYIQTVIVSQISSLYYQLLSLDEQLKVTKEAIFLREETVRTLTAMRDNGKTNSAAVVQAESQLYSAQASIPVIETQIYNTENMLSITLGRKSGNITRGEWKFNVNSSFLSKEIPFYMVANRPDVKAAEYTLVQTFHLSQSAKASLYPSVNFGLDLGAAGNMVNPATFALNFLGGITAPIFNARALRTSYKVSSSKHRQAVTQFDYTLRVAGQNVSEAIFNYKKIEEQLKFRTKEVAANKLAVDYTQQLLLNGKVTYLDVLTAQSSYLSSMLNSINDELKRETTFIELYRALGGGWE